jgi:hypothetical protein
MTKPDGLDEKGDLNLAETPTERYVRELKEAGVGWFGDDRVDAGGDALLRGSAGIHGRISSVIDAIDRLEEYSSDDKVASVSLGVICGVMAGMLINTAANRNALSVLSWAALGALASLAIVLWYFSLIKNRGAKRLKSYIRLRALAFSEPIIKHTIDRDRQPPLE